MHELSIAMSIVDMAAEEAGKRGAARVAAVHLRLGLLSGVVARALLASYELACEQTVLEGSQLIIEDVPVVIFCAACQGERAVASLSSFVCGACGAPGANLLHGREIEVVALELDG